MTDEPVANSLPSIQSILELAARETNNNDLEIYDCGQTKVIGETHVRLSQAGSPIDNEIKKLVSEADVLFLEFDPKLAQAEAFITASSAKTPMLIAKEIAESESKRVFILDNSIPPLLDRLVKGGFSQEEALEILSLSIASQIFTETQKSPIMLISKILENLQVPFEQIITITDEVHNSLMRFIRNEDRGYGIFDFTGDYLRYDSHLRDREYAKILKMTDSDYLELRQIAILGKAHAKPVADILNGKALEPHKVEEYAKQKERLQSYLKSLSSKQS